MSPRHASVQARAATYAAACMCAVLSVFLWAGPADAYLEMAAWYGHRFSGLGRVFDAAGDVNGDGLDDIVVGIAYDGFDNTDGVVWLVLGSRTELQYLSILGR